MTQEKIILNKLKEGPVTAVDAVNMRILRLAAVIHNLKKQGVRIKSDTVKGTRYAKYTLVA